MAFTVLGQDGCVQTSYTEFHKNLQQMGQLDLRTEINLFA
jgi:hypothetical protein